MSHSARDKGGEHAGRTASPRTPMYRTHMLRQWHDRKRGRLKRADGMSLQRMVAQHDLDRQWAGWRLVRWQRPLSLAPRFVPLRASVAQLRRMATLAPAATELPGLLPGYLPSRGGRALPLPLPPGARVQMNDRPCVLSVSCESFHRGTARAPAGRER